MKVLLRGFNLYQQFCNESSCLATFKEQIYENLQDIDITHVCGVLLVADQLIVYKEGKSKILHKNVKIFSTTDNFILFVTHDDKLYKYNLNNEEIKEIPKFFDEINEKILKLSIGNTINTVITSKGFYNIPNKLDFEYENIIQIECGREHCVILNDKGIVYTFGCGSRGQLGHGTLDDEIEPKFVEALGGVPIKKVATKGWHCCALSADGDLYTWGWNSNGQLGHEDVAVMATPKLIEFDQDIGDVACGTRHTIVLTVNGKLYGCGWNKYGQLNADNKELYCNLTFIEDFSIINIERIKCGTWNSIIIIKEN